MVNLESLHKWCQRYVKNHVKSNIIKKNNVYNYIGDMIINQCIINTNSVNSIKFNFDTVFGDVVIDELDVEDIIFPNRITGNLLLCGLYWIKTLDLPKVDSNIIILELEQLKSFKSAIHCNNLNIIETNLSSIDIIKCNSIHIELTEIKTLDTSKCKGDIFVKKNKLTSIKLPKIIFGNLNISENYISKLSDISPSLIYGNVDISNNLFNFNLNPFIISSLLLKANITCSNNGELCY